MKKACIVLVFSLLFSGCPFLWNNQEATVQGIVTLTRNGIPLNPEDFSDSYGNRHMPHISAYRTPPQFVGLFQGDSPLGTRNETSPVGSGHWFVTHSSVSWLGDGKYQWSIIIPDNILPSFLYFDIQTQITDTQHSLGISAISDGIMVRNEDSIIDLGILNLNVIRVSGILPVTINGLPADSARMEVFLENGMHLCSAEIAADGQWSQYVVVPGVETALKFRIEAIKNGGHFRKDLITNTAHTIHDTDREFIFSEYPNIDFNAVTLSGTIKILGPNRRQALTSSMVLFRDGFDNGIPSRVFNTLSSADIRFLNPFGDGSAVWTAVLQDFSIPKRLHFYVSAEDDGMGRSNEFSINITDSTDLSNINLGTRP